MPPPRRSQESNDDDPELILQIPFTSDVKVDQRSGAIPSFSTLTHRTSKRRVKPAPSLRNVSRHRPGLRNPARGQIRGILVAGGDGGTAPSRMRAYLNRNDVDFDLANQMAPVQARRSLR